MKRIQTFLWILCAQFFLFGTLQAQDVTEPKDLSGEFENIHVSPITNGAEISWNLKYKVIEQLQAEGYEVVIRYTTQLLYDRAEKGFASDVWSTTLGLSLETTQKAIENLSGGEEYVFQLGLLKGEQEYWSAIQTTTTKKNWGMFEFFVLLGALALFLYGMKVMSDGLQQATGKKLRNVLGSITSNPFKGILTGLGITTLIQSSSVTTVMTVSFVNAGILTLMQAAGVIMGVNIGTTVTAWLIDIFGFKVDIGPYTLLLLAVGLPLYFVNSSKIKNWANVLIGFALLFMGLGFLKSSVPEVGPDSPIVAFFVGLNNIPYISSVICVLFGAVLTLVIQSSSATVALTMALMASGVIPFEVGAAMVLGENIGTTITAELAATVGNVHAKRAARIHSSFNIFGVIWVLLIFPYFLDLVVFLTEKLAGGSPMENPSAYGSTGLAVLHTVFNILNTSLMVWFIPQLVRLTEKMIKPKEKTDEQFQLEYIGDGLGRTPELSIFEVKKELAKFGEITGRMASFAKELLFETNKKNQNELYDRIKKYEDITDTVEVEVTKYLNKISSKNVDEHLAARINGMNRITSNLERIGDVFYQISKSIEKKNEEEIVFTDTQNERLVEMFDLIIEAFAVMHENLKKHSEDVTLDLALQVEDRINLKRDEIRKEYYNKMLVEQETGLEAQLLYSNIYNSLERVGDHIINVSEGIMGRV